MSDREWQAYKMLPERGWRDSEVYQYVGRFATKDEARQRAGRGGFIEPYRLTPAQGAEEGFPKSFQEFVGPRPTPIGRTHP